MYIGPRLKRKQTAYNYHELVATILRANVETKNVVSKEVNNVIYIAP